MEPVGVYNSNASKYKNCSTTEDAKAALHQRHCMEIRSTVHVVMVSSPHSPIFRGHHSQCSAWAHRDTSTKDTSPWFLK